MVHRRALYLFIRGGSTFGGHISAVGPVIMLLKTAQAQPQYMDPAEEHGRFLVAGRAQPLCFLAFGGCLLLVLRLYLMRLQVHPAGHYKNSDGEACGTDGSNGLGLSLAEQGEKANHPGSGND